MTYWIAIFPTSMSDLHLLQALLNVICKMWHYAVVMCGYVKIGNFWRIILLDVFQKRYKIWAVTMEG